MLALSLAQHLAFLIVLLQLAALAIDGDRPLRLEASPSWIQVVNGVVRTAGYFIGFTPWVLLFLSAWDGSIVPGPLCEEIWGKKSPTRPFGSRLRYIVLPGMISAYTSFIIFLSEYPYKLNWDSFPTFCVAPRSFLGFIAIHQAPMLHVSYAYFSHTHFGLWLVGATLLKHGRRVFVFSTFFSAFVGHFVFWCVGPPSTCIAGFMPVVFGWWGTLLPGIIFVTECRQRCEFILHCLLVAIISGMLLGRLLDGTSNGVLPGESLMAHICGFGSGLVYGLMNCLGFRCFGIALGTFPNFEKKARDVGFPWPGWCEFVFQILCLLCFGCKACRGCFKKATGNEEWFEW